MMTTLGPDLVTLDAAKQHLYVADSDHDVIIGQKIAAASDLIRDYLGAQNDPSWTSETVPPRVVEAVLLLLADLYEHRGDDQGNAAVVWTQIGNILRRTRDTAIA